MGLLNSLVPNVVAKELVLVLVNLHCFEVSKQWNEIGVQINLRESPVVGSLSERHP